MSATTVISLTAFGRVLMISNLTIPFTVRHSTLLITCMRVSVMFFMLVSVIVTALFYSFLIGRVRVC